MSAEELETPVMTTNLSPDASISQKLFKKLSILFMAALNRSTDAKVLKDLDFIAQKDLINKGHFKINELFGKAGKRGSFIHFAAEDHRVAILEWLIESKADVNLANELGDTPLHLAISAAVLTEGKAKDTIEYLLKTGAQRTLKNHAGVSAESKAKQLGINLDNLRASTSASASAPSATVIAAEPVEDEAARQQRELQAQLKHLKMLQKQVTLQLQDLVAAQGEPGRKAELSRSVFTALMDPKNTDALREKQLVNRPVANSGDKVWLHLAAEAADPVLTHALLRAKADPNKQDGMGETALHVACRARATAVVEVLLADTRTDPSVKHYMTQQTAFDAAGDAASEYSSIERNKELRMKVMQSVAQMSSANREAAAASERVQEQVKEQEQEAAVEQQVHASGMSSWKVSCPGPYKDATYGNDFTPLADLTTHSLYKGKLTGVATVGGARPRAGLRAGQRAGRLTATELSRRAGVSTASGSRAGVSASGMRAPTPAQGTRASTGLQKGSLRREGSLPRATGARMSVRERLEARRLSASSKTTTLSAASSSDSPAVEDKTHPTGMPNGDAAQTKLQAVAAAAQHLYDRLQADDLLAPRISDWESGNYGYNAGMGMGGGFYGDHDLDAGAFTSSPSSICARYSSFGNLSTDSEGNAKAAKGIHQLFKVYQTLVPGAPTLPHDVIESIGAARGQPNSENILGLIECFTVACERYKDLSWDFALLDWHNHTPNTYSSGGQARPEAGSSMEQAYGSLGLHLGSAGSLGGVPSNMVDVLTCVNSVDRAADYQSRAAANERIAGKKATLEKKKMLKNPKDTNVMPEPYGRFNHEDHTSARWHEVAEIALDGKDIAMELEQLGFFPPSVSKVTTR